MTYKELSDSFDVYANRYAIEKQRTILFFDEYEKSLFLTNAADEIVKELLPFYDRNEKIKKQLLPITKTATISPTTGISFDWVGIGNDFDGDGVVFELPDDMMYAVLEFLKNTNGSIIDVIKPLGDDETSYSLDSPFRNGILYGPGFQYTYNIAYKNSFSYDGKRYAQITFYGAPPVDTRYSVKYITNTPSFIVTDTLLDASINGVNSNADITQQAPLEMLHNKILNRAVAIGYASKLDDFAVKVNRQKDTQDT